MRTAPQYKSTVVLTISITGPNEHSIKSKWERALARMQSLDFIGVEVILEPLWIKMEEEEDA